MNGFDEKQPVSCFVQHDDIRQAVMLVEIKAEGFKTWAIQHQILFRRIAEIEDPRFFRKARKKLLDH